MNLTARLEATYQAIIPKAPYVPTILLIYQENSPISSSGFVKLGNSSAIS